MLRGVDHTERRGATRRLVAYDGSPSARRALLHAAKLHRQGDDLGVIYVSDDGQDADGHLDEARRLLDSRGVEATPLAIAGSPASTICLTAERLGYDTIVIGRRNMHDAALLLLGSVARRVVAGAPGHVVVVA